MNKRKKLSFEVLKYLIIILGLTFIAVISYIINSIYGDIYEKQEHISQKNTVKNAEEMNKKLSSLQSTIDAVRSELLYLKDKDMSREEKITILGNIMMSNPDIVGGGIFIESNLYDNNDLKYVNTKYSDNSGRFLPYFSKDASGKLNVAPLTDYNGADWYEKPKSLKKTYITKPYEYEVNGEKVQMVTISNIVELNGKYIGVITADITLTYLQNFVKEISNKDVFYEVISSDDIILAHGINSEIVGTPYTFFDIENNSLALEKVKKGESFITYSLTKEKKDKMLKAYSPISFPGVKDNYWSLVSVTSINYVNSQIVGIIVRVVSIAIVLIIIVTYILNSIINRLIIKPLKKLDELMEELSNYDFEMEKRDNDTEIKKIFLYNNEISSILMSMRNMAINMNKLVKQISGVSQNLAATSQELTATAESTASLSEDVSRTIEEISNGATSQAQDTNNCVSRIDKIGEEIEKESDLIKELEKSAQNIEIQKNEGFEVLKMLEEKSDNAREYNEKIYEVVVGVNDSANKIDSASQMIQSISEQTNLLALNAAIEAARAGEAGKGFAVVAEEIRKLAEQSNGFTKDIKEVIQELIKNSDEAVQTMEISKNINKEQLNGVVLTKDKFEKIAEAIEKTRQVVKNVENTSKSIENSKYEIVDIVQNLSAIAQENAASTQEASASMQGQLNSIQEVAQISANLSQSAMQLQEEMQLFRI